MSKSPENKPHPGLSTPEWWKNIKPDGYIWHDESTHKVV